MPAVNQYQLHCVCNTGDSYYGLCCIMVCMCTLICYAYMLFYFAPGWYEEHDCEGHAWDEPWRSYVRWMWQNDGGFFNGFH